MKSTIILLEYIKVGSTSIDLIQIVYLRLDEDRILEYEYFIDKSILFVQNYDIDDLKKHA